MLGQDVVIMYVILTGCYLIILFYLCFSRTLGGSLDENSFCYTLEVSFYSYIANTGTSNLALPYTEEGCILFYINQKRQIQNIY